VVEMLKRFKTSGNIRENEIFACMVHNLFDEYRFFSSTRKGSCVSNRNPLWCTYSEQLVSSITLGTLRYVLEALGNRPRLRRDYQWGKMFKFGMFALEQFKGSHEWPQYCSHIVQILTRKGTRIWLQKSNMK
jgi:CCR4-NOT transcription complex subunit 1